jgi:hypothetical protein
MSDRNHPHHCPECRTTWSHDDHLCDDLDADKVCESCMRVLASDWYTEEPPVTLEELDQDVAQDAALDDLLNVEDFC